MALPGVLAPLYLPHYDIGFRLGPLACCWGCVSGVRRLRILLYSQFAPPLVSCSRSKLIRWVSGLIYVASCPEFVVSVVRLLSFQLNTSCQGGVFVAREAARGSERLYGSVRRAGGRSRDVSV